MKARPECRLVALGAATILALALAACSGLGTAASDAPGSPGLGSAPSATVAPSYPGGAAGCAVTPDAPASGTVEMVGRAFKAPATVRAGQSVAFVNRDNTTHTITEGTNGHAGSETCVRQRVRAFESTVITFLLPGDYPITCTIHGTMQTVVHVRL